ncbi:MAG: T9SS type A sorting domain-containing protein [Bacteroidota bacterium]
MHPNSCSYFRAATAEAIVSVTDQRTYHFLHELPVVGANYYRIRQHDFDGTTSLSEVRRLTFSEVNTGGFSLFSNPATGRLTIRLNQSGTAPAEVHLMTITGQIVRTFAPVAENGEWQLPLGDLPAGVYLVSVGEESRRLIKHARE